MTHFIRQILRKGLRRKGLVLVLAYLVLLLASSGLIRLAEPPDSGLNHFGQAMWWSIVTSTTVGYGDLFPVSGLGKLIAVILPMFMGIGLGAAFITHIASSIIERRDKRMHGERPYTGTGQILIVGSAGETVQLIREIQNDESYADQDIVLVADIDRHPLPDADTVFFVKGRPDTMDALSKAGIAGADRAIIHTGNDEESLFALINALNLKKETCEITVRCISSHSLDTFSSVPGSFQVIMQMTAEMMVQAMQDKVHIPLQVLLKNNEDEEIYYVTVPDAASQTTWWKLHEHFKTTCDFLTFAMQTANGDIMVNPPADQMVSKLDGIWLIASQRPVNIPWP